MNNLLHLLAMRGFKLIVIFYLLCANTLFAQNEKEKADSLINTGNYLEALKIHEALLAKDLEKGDKKQQIKDYNNMAVVYSRMSNYASSTSTYFKALKMAELINDKRSQEAINYNIAKNYYTLGDRKIAEEFLNKVFKNADSETKPIVSGSCYNLLGALAFDEKNWPRCKDLHLKAIKEFAKTNDKDLLANAYNNYATLLMELKENDEAAKYTSLALNLYKEVNDYDGLSVSYFNLHMCSVKNKVKPGKDEVKYSLKLLDSAQKYCNKTGDIRRQIGIYGEKQYVYSYLNMHDSTIVYIAKFAALQDSLHSLALQEQNEAEKVKYDFEKKEQDNALLQKANQNQFYLLMIVLVAATAIILVGILLFRISRLKSLQKNLQLEQKLLRLQMNPHFLFNAINSIQRYILNNNKQEAYDYLAKFAKLIRIVLDNSQEKKLSLAQELEMIRLYVELEQMRFEKSFDFTIEKSDSVTDDDIYVPAMLIQPYVENAIWHGLMNLEGARKGKLSIRTDTNGKELKIIIEDNGVGREKSGALKKDEKHKSVGMRLTEQRLLLINKMAEYQRARVNIDDLFNENKEVNGTRVQIVIPVDEK